MDGGYICYGVSTSNDFDLEYVSGVTGNWNLWVVKLDSEFNIDWQTVIDNSEDPSTTEAVNILSNADTTYTIFAVVKSDAFGNCNCNHSSSTDFWLINLDSIGNQNWQKCYGGFQYENPLLAVGFGNDGYILSGTSASSDGDIPFHYGDVFTTDGVVIKTDGQGNIQWIKDIGGSGYEASLTREISNDRLLISTGTSSHDFDLDGIMPETETGGELIWVTDTSGNILKEGFLPYNNGNLSINNIYELDSSAFIFLGSNKLDTGIFEGNHGYYDATIAILDSSLELKNVFQFGGSNDDYFTDMYIGITGYYFTGLTNSSDGDAWENRGERDAFIVKTDSDFNKLWSYSFGSSGTDLIAGLFEMENELIVFGSSGMYAINDGDIIGSHWDNLIGANNESWVMRIDQPTQILEFQSEELIKIYPNPAGDYLIVEIPNEFTDRNMVFKLVSLNGDSILENKISNNTQTEISINNLISQYYIGIIVDLNTGRILTSQKIFIK